MCHVNSRHFVPDVELEFHEKQCEDPLYRQIVAELKTEPVPVKSMSSANLQSSEDYQSFPVPSSDSSDDGNESEGDTTSVSSGDTDYSTSKDELLRRILEGPDLNEE
ncbi:hypothetical protein ANCCAN_29351 [Ancylostoma caninum]|uniref:Uncharacterized protein n=1 Tax=Ancylostoma caninum TaxID=29170 RepID=A0A368EYQ1_ANCCA|nr:hypothetical protein ANCCAN_29351 [Ancylostoma caninum]